MEHLEDTFIPNLKPLFKAVIPNFTNSIVVAQKMQVKPYKKTRLASMPKKIINLIGTEYIWNEKGILVDKKGVVVPSNPKNAGQPRIWQVNFQDLYNGKLNSFAVNARLQKMKEYILPYVEENEFIEETGLGLELKFFIEKKGQGKFNADIDNLSALWFKAVLDALKGVIIRDDDTSVVTGLKSSISFVDYADTKLEILIWKR